MTPSTQIRQTFLDFFRSKGHTIVDSAPVVTFEDPTLLFTNSGMNQFKDVFLGKGSRAYTRVADTQKCIRVSGKHNDLEEVGYDTYHHTFFEMLGNWSFGDYYKKESIEWAWELFTIVWKLPKEKLYATVYKTDDEAESLWKTITDIPHDHIIRFGEKENFWEMGDTGPCGPCSEIHIDLGPEACDKGHIDHQCQVNGICGRYIELWNLVFIQYNRKPDQSLEELPAKHVDTGMGFERITCVLQNKKSNYDTDVFTPIISKISSVSGKPYLGEFQIPMRVIADHIRSISFSIADGVIPSNDGRGYVIRRILRRASRYGRKLGFKGPFLFRIVETLGDVMGDIFPEIRSRRLHVERVIKAEEESFNSALDRGTQILDDIIAKEKNSGKQQISGADAFKLYDTYGFPIDLTRLMASEVGFSVDEIGFTERMEEQRDRARKAGKFTYADTEEKRVWKTISSGADSEFKGYELLEVSDCTIRIIRQGVNFIEVVLDKTPFYAESGGQVGDIGYFEFDGQKYPVIDTQKIDDKIVHFLESFPAESVKGQLKAVVNITSRKDTARNHTATHLLHSALKKVLGSHIKQAGSLVAPDRLRFDFSHFEKINDEQLLQIEHLVKSEVRKSVDLTTKNMSFDSAQKDGAVALFGEKYGSEVRVISIGDFSKELCGGTHLQNTSEIGNFRILSESSVAAGVRRIEAVTGTVADQMIEQDRHLIKLLSSVTNHRQENELLSYVQQLIGQQKQLEKEIAELRFLKYDQSVQNFINSGKLVNGINLITGHIPNLDLELLKQLGDKIRERSKITSVGILFTSDGEKVQIVTVVTDDLIKGKGLNAGKIVGLIAKEFGGNGGGKPHLATAGGKNPDLIQKTTDKLPELLHSFFVN